MGEKSTWNSSFTILFSFFFLAFFRPSVLCVDLKTRSSNRPPNVQSSNRSSSVLRSSAVHRSSSNLFFLCSSSNHSSCSSSGLRSIVQLEFKRSSFFLCSSFLLKCQNRVSNTRFFFLELKSIRLDIYLTSYFQLTKWESSL